MPLANGAFDFPAPSENSPAAPPPSSLHEAEPAPAEAQRAHMMLRVLGSERLAFFESERADFYLTILYKMLLLRREHELQPLHEDLYYAVRASQMLLAEDYDLNQFAADLAQLLAWGNLTKVLEPYRLRSYKDSGRENFRYVLNENTVEFLQWLEYRVRTRAEGRSHDGRNFLQDLVAALQELDRLCETAASHPSALQEESARRVLHLMYSIEDRVHDLSSELLEFRAAMVQFVTRAYNLETLKAILHWLARYLEIYLQGIYALRERLLLLAARLDNAAARAVIDQCQALMEEQRRQIPQALRGEVATEPINAERFLRRLQDFFAPEQKFDHLCERINGTAREVIKKIDARLRELERRNTRIHDLKSRIHELAHAPKANELANTAEEFRQVTMRERNGKDEACPAGYYFINALLAPSFAIFDLQHWNAHNKAAPPRPRSASRRDDRAIPKRYLRAKIKSRQDLFASEAEKREELRRWIETVLLQGKPQMRLVERLLDDPRAAQYWMKLLHYAYVTPAKNLPALRVALKKIVILAETPASVLLGDESSGLYTPDHIVLRA